MGHKYFEDQLDNEKMLLMFRKHPIVMRNGLILASLGMIVGPVYVTILTYARPNNPPSMQFFFMSMLLSMLVAGVLFFPSWLSWYFSVYALTDRRLMQIKQRGFFNRALVDISNDQISMVNYEIKGFQETVLGFGTITVQTYVGELVIKDVAHPKKIHKELSSLLRDNGFLTGSSTPFNEERTEDKDK